MDDLNNLGGILKGFVGICNTEILKSYVKVKNSDFLQEDEK